MYFVVLVAFKLAAIAMALIPRSATLAAFDTAVSDRRFELHLQRNLADAAIRAALRAEVRCRLERALSLWAAHGRRLMRNAWLEHNGLVCALSSGLRVAFRAWRGLSARANQKAFPRALFLLRVLLRTRTKAMLTHWAEEASRLVALEALADSFRPRIGRGLLRCWRAT